jgi:hypothetical protein
MGIKCQTNKVSQFQTAHRGIQWVTQGYLIWRVVHFRAEFESWVVDLLSELREKIVKRLMQIN